VQRERRGGSATRSYRAADRAGGDGDASECRDGARVGPVCQLHIGSLEGACDRRQTGGEFRAASWGRTDGPATIKFTPSLGEERIVFDDADRSRPMPIKGAERRGGGCTASGGAEDGDKHKSAHNEPCTGERSGGNPLTTTSNSGPSTAVLSRGSTRPARIAT
jgi:hypothetical protein